MGEASRLPQVSSANREIGVPGSMALGRVALSHSGFIQQGSPRRIQTANAEDGVINAISATGRNVHRYGSFVPHPVHAALFRDEKPIQDEQRTCAMAAILLQGGPSHCKRFDDLEHRLECFLAVQGRKPAWHEGRAGNLGTPWPGFGVDILHRPNFECVWKRQGADVVAGMVRIDVYRVPIDLRASIRLSVSPTQRRSFVPNALGFLGREKVELGVLEEHDGFAVLDFAGEDHLKGCVEV